MEKEQKNSLLTCMYELQILVSDLIKLSNNMNENKEDIEMKLLEVNQLSKDVLKEDFDTIVKSEYLEDF